MYVAPANAREYKCYLIVPKACVHDGLNRTVISPPISANRYIGRKARKGTNQTKLIDMRAIRVVCEAKDSINAKKN